MSNQAELVTALAPLLGHLATLDPDTPGVAAQLDRDWPADGPGLAAVRALVHQGAEAGWLCTRGAEGLRYDRLARASEATRGFSIDAVDMNAAGPGHEHPNGEFDLCFSLEGDPRFDGHAQGWTVYGARSWHVPTVSQGRMVVLYFLPGGKIRFGPPA